MTTQTQVRSTDEALKLALEALNTNRVMAKDSEGNYTREITPKLIVEAITAIKEALMSLCDGAQQSAERVNPQGVSNEQVEPTCWITTDGEGFRMRMTPPVNDVPLGWMPLFDHPPVPYVVEPRTAQPKEPEHSAPHGEPVAWAWFDEEDGRLSGALDYEQPPHYTVPLYTTPPQCPSRSDIKPLTDEQIDAAIKNSKKVDTGYAGWVRDQRREFARAIEVAHGIRPTDFKE